MSDGLNVWTLPKNFVLRIFFRKSDISGTYLIYALSQIQDCIFIFITFTLKNFPWAVFSVSPKFSHTDLFNNNVWEFNNSHFKWTQNWLLLYNVSGNSYHEVESKKWDKVQTRKSGLLSPLHGISCVNQLLLSSNLLEHSLIETLILLLHDLTVTCAIILLLLL